MKFPFCETFQSVINFAKQNEILRPNARFLTKKIQAEYPAGTNTCLRERGRIAGAIQIQQVFELGWSHWRLEVRPHRHHKMLQAEDF